MKKLFRVSYRQDFRSGWYTADIYRVVNGKKYGFSFIGGYGHSKTAALHEAINLAKSELNLLKRRIR